MHVPPLHAVHAMHAKACIRMHVGPTCKRSLQVKPYTTNVTYIRAVGPYEPTIGTCLPYCMIRAYRPVSARFKHVFWVG